jgi:hypothetical protein
MQLSLLALQADGLLEKIQEILPDQLRHWGALVGILLLLLILALRFFQPDRYPYVARPTLFTKAELKFLEALEEAVDVDYAIYGQVRLCDVIEVRKGMDRKSWGRAFAKIRAKHLDFVICDPEDHEIICAIELDDATHDRADRRKRDYFLNRAMAAAGVPLHRFPTSSSYDPKEIREAIES